MQPAPGYVEATFNTLNETCYGGMWGPNEFTCSGVLKDYDGTQELADIEVPVLLTCGEHDEAAPVSCREFAAMIRDCEYVEFADASHLAFVEVPDAYLAAVNRFLQG